MISVISQWLILRVQKPRNHFSVNWIKLIIISSFGKVEKGRCWGHSRLAEIQAPVAARVAVMDQYVIQCKEAV